MEPRHCRNSHRGRRVVTISKPLLHIIHGDDPPLWAVQHAEQWARYAEVKVWSFAEILEDIGQPFAEFCERVESDRFRANYVRHWILYRYGGSYADWDTEPVSNPYRIDEWGDHFVIAPHPNQIPWVDNCFMWVPGPGHPTAKAIVDLVDFSQLTAKQITRLTASDSRRLRLPMAWNRNRETNDAIIHHYYLSASLDKYEMAWLMPRLAGQRVVEAGCGLRSIELARVCDLRSIEHQSFYADRCSRVGVDVRLATLKAYPEVFAASAPTADTLLIDGRRRIDCLSAALETTLPGTRAYLHDSKRPRYQVPKGWEQVEACPVSTRGLVELVKV